MAGTSDASKDFDYRSTLKDVYGFTDKLIEELGKPDKKVPNPHHKSGSQSYLYSVKRVEQFKAAHAEHFRKAAERRTRVSPPTDCDLLAAIFAVNHAAKRHRDAGKRQFEAENHGLAKYAKQRKESLYALKDKGIAAYKCGLLTPEQIHGGLCVYSGERYCFHSSLLPTGLDIPRRERDAPITVEAKPQGSNEPRQRDAIHKLRALPEIDLAIFTRLEIPRIVTGRPPRSGVCKLCGETGHIGRDCPDSDEYDEGAWE